MVQKMTKEINPLIPVNPEGLDNVVRELLDENVNVNDVNQVTGTNPPKNPEDYLILETVDSKNNKIGLYVAKDKDFFGKNWYEAHQELSKEGYQMLTIRQGIDLIKMLKSKKVYDGLRAKLNDAEIAQLLNEIIELRSPWRAEWLDARFAQENNEWYLFQGHKYDVSKQGKLEDKVVAKSRIKVSPLIENIKFDLKDVNQYGLPTKKGSELDYWYPTNGSVARFNAGSYVAGLNCSWGPSYSYRALAVRRAKIRN